MLNRLKKELKGMSTELLQEKLKELQKDQMLTEGRLRGNFHTKNRYGYPALSNEEVKGIGNKRKLNKTIAIIKTYLNQKNGNV